MPALMNSRVGSSAGINEELLTTVWPRSSKNFRNRRRTSLLFMKRFQFLSNGILLISKTYQRSKKTSRLARTKRRAQFAIDHCSVDHLAERRPLHLFKLFSHNGFLHPPAEQLLAKIFAACCRFPI